MKKSADQLLRWIDASSAPVVLKWWYVYPLGNTKENQGVDDFFQVFS